METMLEVTRCGSSTSVIRTTTWCGSSSAFIFSPLLLCNVKASRSTSSELMSKVESTEGGFVAVKLANEKRLELK